MNGQTIPIGIRNNTIHRLLSSDRAKGMLSKSDLITKAEEYRLFCEDKESITDNEIQANVESVLKYPAMNNNYEKVTDNYVKWLKTHNTEVESNLKEKLSKVDESFFTRLGKSIIPIPLSDIETCRDRFFEQNGYVNYPNYTPALFAQKLKSYGFERIRTAKCNLWKVNIQNVL
jgi:hypothetical protein